MRRLLPDARGVAVSLAAAAVGWCLVVALLMTQFPMMRGGREPSLGEAAAMIFVPAIASIVGTWAAWERWPVLLGVAACVVGLFALVTGFSIGSAFLPAFGLLVWATFGTVSSPPEAEQA